MMLSVKEVADRLSLSVGAVYKAVQHGELACHRFGTAIRITDEQLNAYLERTRTGKTAGSETSTLPDLFSTED